jgi:probable phosphoglycerate mutase
VRLFLVRHGETDSNRDGLALGRADVPLNETGRGQSRRLAEALAGEPIAALYASPLLRTMATADEIAARHGLPVRADERLMEMDVGELDGMAMSDVRSRYPGVLEKWLSAEGHLHAMPGGESLEDVSGRAWAFVESLREEHGEETVCAVTHNFVILSILSRALGLEGSAFRRIRHGVAAISVIDITGDRVQVTKVNDACHLA